MRRKRTAISAGAVLVLVIVAGVGAGLALSARQATKTGGSPATVLNQVLSRFGDDFVTDSRLDAKPADYRCTDGSAPTSPECAAGEWLNLTVRTVSATGPEVVRPVWEAELIAGELRAAITRAGGVPIYQLTVTTRLPSGAVAKSPIGGLGEAPADASYANPTDSELSKEVMSGASAVHVTVRSADVYHPASPALALVLQVSDPVAFMQRINETLTAIVPNAADLEGLYIEVDDAGGVPFYVSSYAQSAGVGHRWARPGLIQSGPVPPNAEQ